MDKPLCECHREPMRWAGNGGGRHGWRCVIKQREAQARYRRTAKGKASNKHYDHTAKGKARQRRYDSSEAGVARKREWSFLNR